jgi:hypothetical protein
MVKNTRIGMPTIGVSVPYMPKCVNKHSVHKMLDEFIEGFNSLIQSEISSELYREEVTPIRLQ